MARLNQRDIEKYSKDTYERKQKFKKKDKKSNIYRQENDNKNEHPKNR